MMKLSSRKAALGKDYGIALLSVAIAFAITYATWPAFRPTPWALFFAAVMASAWFGGMGPSLLATALAAVLGNVLLHRALRLGVPRPRRD